MGKLDAPIYGADKVIPALIRRREELERKHLVGFLLAALALIVGIVLIAHTEKVS